MRPGPRAARQAALLLSLAALSPCGAFAQDSGEVTTPSSDTEDKPSAEEVRENVVSAGEDPLQKWHAETQTDEIDERVGRPLKVLLYGSARLDYTIANSTGKLGDAGSRFGAFGEWAPSNRLLLFARAEAGLDLIEGFSDLSKSGSKKSEDDDSKVFDRLLYGGIETRRFLLVFGKNWSTYYQVSGFTDEFDSTGGDASGTYNAGTDGGPTGTGRADLALQAHISLKGLAERIGAQSLHLNLQAQDGRPIPGFDDAKYGVSIGTSGIIRFSKNVELGLAYNFAEIQLADRPALAAAGINGNAHAALLGVRWIDNDWYLATTVARLVNHEATDGLNYFDGWGWEVYARRQITTRFSIVGGWNWLKPDADEIQANDYRQRYGVIGARYALSRENGLERYAYVEWRIDDSREENGDKVGNSIVLGLRMDL
ncbi:hypothetical protein [Altererythrobacter sp.]|uniref:hypothetical protein n=1 Tax=Altererythrobacter sp. TaxID=1872480 RepID=UPI003D0A0E6C